jgi:transposase
VRWVMVELAWCWLEYQPGSELSGWYRRRYGAGNSGQRKVGIVALARKLLVALWKYLTGGEVPEGAVLVLKKGVHRKQSVVSHAVSL